MRLKISTKLISILVLFTIFVITTFSMVFYFSTSKNMMEHSTNEISGSVAIASLLVLPDTISGLESKDPMVLERVKTKMNFIGEANKGFHSIFIADKEGRILGGDKTLFDEGMTVGDTLPFDKSNLKSGKESIVTEEYELNGLKRKAALFPIPDEKGEIIGYFIIESNVDSVIKTTKDSIFNSIFTALIFPLIGVVILYFVIRKTMKPISVVTEELQRISKGDLSFEPTVFKTKDEIEVLSVSFKDMTSNLSHLIGKVANTEQLLIQSAKVLNQNSQKTLESNKKINGQIEAVSEGARNQLFQTKESAAAMDEISSQVIQIAKNSEVMKKSTSNTASSVQEMATSVEQISKSSQNASKLAEEVQKSASKGKEHVDLSKTEMEAISEIIEEATGVMKHLGKSSEEIGTIVEVIDSIAEQTNLLALNAAIEAARAGEHGKGFSVVADEVKNLAERSANATKEIATLIRGIQEETKRAVDAIEVGNEKVNEGNRLAESASEAIGQIVREIKQISEELYQISHATSAQAEESGSIVKDISRLEEQVNQVAKATQEQTIGVNEITKSIGKISEISQESTEQLNVVATSSKDDLQSIEEIAKSATELDGLALELHETVKNFTLKK